MRRRWCSWILGSSLVAAAACAAPGVSYYPDRPPDPAAVTVTADQYPVHGDGVGDDTAALQQAINRVQETTVRGVVLLPPGRYRISQTLHVWTGIRLIGYGATRPTILLGPSTPGFASGEGRYLLHFTAGRPAAGQPIRDANPGTFYSGLSNIDLEIGPGNPAAIGVRSHFAQHGFLAHVDFRTGDGRAGVEAVGNEIDNCRFFGGDYGILTKKPSPSWPFVLIDSVFEGQRVAAIRTEETGMTIVRGEFRDVPTVVEVNAERSEELFIEDARFLRVTGPALVISEEANARTQVNLQNIACEQVPQLVRWRESGRELAGVAPRYVVRTLSHGLHVPAAAAVPGIETRFDAAPVVALPVAVPSDVPRLPPMDTWVSARDLGAVGDGMTDDTAALQAAVAQARTVFLPAGRYRLTDTLTLRPESVLVGLSPITTQLILAEDTPAFLGQGAVEAPPERSSGVRVVLPRSQGSGPPKALLEAPPGGPTIVTGLGLDTGNHHRAVALKWRAGADSLVNDVRFHGGHGTYRADGSAPPLYNQNRTGEADPSRRWDSQYWSLWVTDGGGGTFKNIWTPNPLAQAGLYVSDTTTSGRVYAMSSEHHVRQEVVLRRMANWRFYALQFETERGEGPEALPLELDQCRNVQFANLYLYRVMTTYAPFPYAVRLQDSSDIRFRGVHVYSPSKFTYDATLYDGTSGRQVWSREIAWADAGTVAAAAPTRPVAVFGLPGARESLAASPPAAAGLSLAEPLVRLATGFNSIDGFAVDAAGSVYFVDTRWQRIYRWEAGTGEVRLWRDLPVEPVGLAFDTVGHLLVVTRLGTVLAFDPARPEDDWAVLEPRAGAPRGATSFVVPVTRWRDSHDFLPVQAAPTSHHFLAPDGQTAIPAPAEFIRAGYANSFYSTIDLIRAYGLARVEAGQPVVVADEFGQKTWRLVVQPNGTLAEPVLVAEEGEGAPAVAADGRSFVPAGLVFVYAADGALLGTIEVPERPMAVVLGGRDRRTLLIAARHSLYAAPLD